MRKTRKRAAPSDKPLFEAMTPQRIIWFWNKVDRSAGDDACHPWTGTALPEGYGIVQWTRDATRYCFLAHRIAWALTYGTDPATLNQVVRHNCGNSSCCNPRHLVLGTYRDVWLDQIARGQRSIGAERYAFGKYGADACAARYGWEERTAADRLRWVYHWPLARIAAYFGCSLATVHRWTTPP